MRRIGVFCIGLLAFVGVANAETVQSICQAHDCLAVVDAGSTGSRLHVFAYDEDASHTPVHIHEVYSRKISPGFASIPLNQSSINHYLDTLFTDFPAEEVPVYFYATAGMRLVAKNKQETYYSYLNQWFSANYKGKLLAAKTIKGKEEGLLGWLAVNYELGHLSSPSEPLTGVMDMGGASVQIAFPVTDKAQSDPNDLVTLTLYNRKITVFVHSFLGLGQTEVAHQFLDEGACFSNDYPLPSGEVGKGDANTCQTDISDLVNHVHHANQVIRPALTHNPNQTWYAMGGLGALASDNSFHFTQGEFTSQDLLTKGNADYCQTHWDSVKDQDPDNDYLYGYCLFSSYYYALLVNGYGLSSHEPIHYLNNPKNSDWTLGVVLHQGQP